MMTAEQVQATLETLRPTQEKVERAVQAAVEIARPSRVLVFGSWARGEARWNSDLDLAVLLPDEREAEIGSLRHALRRKLDEIPMSIDLVFTTEGCASAFCGSLNSIYHLILTEGQVVYEQPLAFASAGSAH